MTKPPLTPEEARRLAARFCGPQRILSDAQLKSALFRKRRGLPQIERATRKRPGKNP